MRVSFEQNHMRVEPVPFEDPPLLFECKCGEFKVFVRSQEDINLVLDRDHSHAEQVGFSLTGDRDILKENGYTG